MDLRERIVAACAEGASQVSVAHRFGVCSKTVQHYVARAARGELAPRPHPGATPSLRPDQEATFLAMVQEKSDWAIDQLCVEWQRRSGVLLPRSTLHDHLQRLKGRYKKRVESQESVVSKNAPPLPARSPWCQGRSWCFWTSVALD
jgi:transposase